MSIRLVSVVCREGQCCDINGLDSVGGVTHSTDAGSRAEKKLNFALLPAGGEETASSRIRVFTFERELASRGIRVTRTFSPSANVLFVQKRVTPRILWLARLAKAMGRIVIYDVDDLGDALWYWVPRPLFVRMLTLADVVTTCTEEQRDFLAAHYHVRRSRVVLPTIDYYPTGPVRLPLRDGMPLRVMWFGSASNVHLLQRYLGVLLAIPQVSVVVVTSHKAVEGLLSQFPLVECIPWTLASFVSTLQSCDVACLMHDGSAEDRAKGNNKMITSIAWGVPTVVSRTPAYERTAREAGVETYLFNDEQGLAEAIERLRSADSRRQYLTVAQPAVWGRYAPELMAQEYVNIALERLRVSCTARSRLGLVAESLLPHPGSSGDAV